MEGRIHRRRHGGFVECATQKAVHFLRNWHGVRDGVGVGDGEDGDLEGGEPAFDCCEVVGEGRREPVGVAGDFALTPQHEVLRPDHIAQIALHEDDPVSMFPGRGQGRQKLDHDLDGMAPGLGDPLIVLAQGAGLFIFEVASGIALIRGAGPRR